MKAAMRQAGFTLIELMIAMALSLALLAALAGLFVNTSRSNSEMAKTNSLIENGRFSIQLLQEDLVHAGYWGGYLPEFDNLASTGIPGDVPSMVPDPCSAFNTWDATYRNAVLGIVTQVYGDLAAETTCAFAAPQRPGTDVLVVRHAGKCVAGTAGCDADVPGRLHAHRADDRNGALAGAADGTRGFVLEHLPQQQRDGQNQ